MILPDWSVIQWIAVLLLIWATATIMAYVYLKYTNKLDFLMGTIESGVQTYEERYGTREGKTGLENIIETRRERKREGDSGD